MSTPACDKVINFPVKWVVVYLVIVSLVNVAWNQSASSKNITNTYDKEFEKSWNSALKTWKSGKGFSKVTRESLLMATKYFCFNVASASNSYFPTGCFPTLHASSWSQRLSS
jgi:hypothetical protein